MKLTDIKIRNLKPKEKQFKVSDGKNLFLVITTTGSKYWRYKYIFNGREKSLALGVYPNITLSQAREKRNEAKQQLANGQDPSFIKQISYKNKKQAIHNSFEIIAREWHTKFISKWTTEHAKTIIARLEKNVFPWIGNKPILETTPIELLKLLQKIESRGAIETAHRVLQICGQIFKYAIITSRTEVDPSAALKGALKPVQKRHLAGITNPEEIGKLLHAINDYKGYFVTKCALQLAPLVFVRPGELRHAEWSEFNFDTAEWRIPATKMKMKSLHIVPLATQALAILRELFPLTGNGQYVFPGLVNLYRPMSNNTIRSALRRLGYTSDEMTAHGFRSMACTILNEQGWNRDAIERQLAHSERNNIRAAYNYAEYLPERRKMMQEWANYLDQLKNFSPKGHTNSLHSGAV
jgi:integrase